MTEHLTQQEIEAVWLRTISAADRGRIDAHVAGCEGCLQHLARPEYAVTALDEAFLTLDAEAPFHLSPEELRAFARGNAGDADRVICESHLENCTDCTRDLHALETLRQLPARPLTNTAGVSPIHWRTSLALVFTPVRVFAVAGVIACLLFAVLIFQRQRRNERTEVAVQPKSTAETPPAPNTNEGTLGRSEVSIGLAVALNDNGNTIGVDSRGKLVGLEQLSVNARQTIAEILLGRDIPKPKDLEAVSSPPIALMGAQQSESFKLFSPLSIVVPEERPTLRWQDLSGAESYTVSIFDEDFNQVTASPPLSRTSWVVNKELRPGGIYSWQVKAIRNGEEVLSPVAPAKRAQFKVLEKEKLRELTLLRQQRPASHLALGVSYLQFGLLEKAESEFRQLLKTNPDSAVVKKLLRRVDEWKRQSG